MYLLPDVTEGAAGDGGGRARGGVQLLQDVQQKVVW